MGTPTVTPSFYADFKGLDRLRSAAGQQDPQALREAARQFEGLFTAMMLKSMREASLGPGLGESQETQTYQDMYDQQLALNIAHGKGLGLADVLMQQLTRTGAAHAAAAQGAVGAASASSDASAESPMSSAQKADFVRRLQPIADAAAPSLGVAPDTLIAHAALETGWGRSVPTDASGQSSFNLFGLKAGNSWRGASVTATTTEYEQGAPSSTAAAFRSYDSAAQSVKDYVALIRSSPRYAGAVGAGSNVQAFASALQRGGYATDPDYANKLVATAATLRQLRVTELKS